jgi:hypothetical protein
MDDNVGDGLMDLSNILSDSILLSTFFIGWISIATGFLVGIFKKSAAIITALGGLTVTVLLAIVMYWLIGDMEMVMLFATILLISFLAASGISSRVPFVGVTLFHPLGSLLVLLSFLGLSVYTFGMLWLVMTALLLYITRLYHPPVPQNAVLAAPTRNPLTPAPTVVQRPRIVQQTALDIDGMVLEWINDSIGLSTLSIIKRQVVGDKLHYTLKDGEGNIVSTVALKDGTVVDFVIVSGEDGNTKRSPEQGSVQIVEEVNDNIDEGSYKPRFCRKCGQNLSTSGRFCSKCGERVVS